MGRLTVQRRYDTDPPSSGSTGRPVFERNVFDTDRYMRALRAGLIDGISPQEHPNDNLLIATVIQLGCPRWSAEQMRGNPALRLAFYGIWVMNREAARGDKEAQEIIDVARAAWDQQRREHLVDDDPRAAVSMPQGSGL